MRRSCALFLLAGLVLAPAAAAKGPHAVLSSGPHAIQPGKPWFATFELMEYDRGAFPTLVARRGERRITAEVRRLRTGYTGTGGTAFRALVVFPTAGRWRLTLVERNRRFVFPPLPVGAGRAPSDYVAFPKGSEAERAGGGGELTGGPEPAGSGPDTVLPPEVTILAKDRRDEDGGISLWIPALGLALAGAGLCTFRARR